MLNTLVHALNYGTPMADGFSGRRISQQHTALLRCRCRFVWVHGKETQRHLKKEFRAGRWWGMPLIPALGRERQADLCEFEASLVYKS